MNTYRHTNRRNSAGRARVLAGRHALVSFTCQDDMGIVADACQSFVFDNGEFSIWKKGGSLDADGYIRWIEQWQLAF